MPGKPWTNAEGKLHSIGVSNMTPKMYEALTADFETKLAVSQVEFNPTFQQKTLGKLLEKDGVFLEVWCPLGHGNKDLLINPVLTKLAEKYHKNTDQIILYFEIQEGIIALPKSTNPEHIQTNLDILILNWFPKKWNPFAL